MQGLAVKCMISTLVVLDSKLIAYPPNCSKLGTVLVLCCPPCCWRLEQLDCQLIEKFMQSRKVEIVRRSTRYRQLLWLLYSVIDFLISEIAQAMLKSSPIDAPDALEGGWRENFEALVPLLNELSEKELTQSLQQRVAKGKPAHDSVCCGLLFGLLTDSKRAPSVRLATARSADCEHYSCCPNSDTSCAMATKL